MERPVLKRPGAKSTGKAGLAAKGKKAARGKPTGKAGLAAREEQAARARSTPKTDSTAEDDASEGKTVPKGRNAFQLFMHIF